MYEEALRYVKGEGFINETLRRVASDLEKRGIPYAVIGAVALGQHGFPRLTTDIDLLMSPQGLEQFQQKLVGLGYRPAFTGARKKFRILPENVPLEIITTGEFPGDGKPKEIAFPDPAEAFVVIDGVRTVPLHTLIELKLASGMTGAGRLKDLGDVEQLIQIKNLPEDYAEQLSPYVREKYLELWRGVAELRLNRDAPGFDEPQPEQTT